jgi:polysaccharide biosynthesis transport protein
MSRYFDLMNSQGSDSVIPPPSSGVSRSKLNLPTRFDRRRADMGQGFSMARFLRVVQERRWTIATFAIVVVVIVMTASLLMKPQYEAVGRVVFHRDSDSGVLGFKGVDTSLLEDPEDRAAIDTQIGILQTDALAMQVIKDLHLDEDPQFAGRLMPPGSEDRLVEFFHKNLKISKVKGTRLIEIDFRSSDPKLAADIVNNLVNDYVDQFYKSQFQTSTQISDFLSNQLKDLQAKVAESQQKLVDYQKANGIFGMDDKQNIVIAKLDDLNTMLTAAEADRVQKEVNYRLARSGQPELIAKLDPDNLITKLRGQQADLESQIAQASVQLGPANPKMKELSNQLAQVKQSLKAEVKRIGERISYEYQSAVAREDMLRGSLEAQKQAANTLNANVIQANILKHDFETNRQLYENLLQKQKEVGISSNLKSSNLWIVDPARPPKLPAEPKILRNFALAVLFGISGGVLLALGLAKMNEKIDTLEQAILVSPIPSLGVVPLLGVKGKHGAVRQFPGVNRNVKPELVSSLQPLSLAAECYRAMLTSVLLSHSTPPTVILVTSALAGEGKTTVSTNLAIALARSHKRVLLVDTDLRRPNVHRALRLTATAGLGAILKKSATFEQVVIGCAGVPNLFVLPVGPVNLSDDTELLVSTFKDLVARWREEFDHIIIDTPPVLPVTDAVRMSVEADSVILVVRAGQVTKDEFLKAQDLLLKVNAPLCGFVLNGGDLGSSDYGYYYGYHSEGETKHLGAGA